MRRLKPSYPPGLDNFTEAYRRARAGIFLVMREWPARQFSREAMDEIRKAVADPQTAIAEDILLRLPKAAQPLLDLFDECLKAGMILQFETIGYSPHAGRHMIDKPRVVKVVA